MPPTFPKPWITTRVEAGSMPRRLSAHFIQRHVRRVPDTALARASRDRVLHAISGEYFDPAIVKLDWDMDRDLLVGALEHLAHAVVKTQPGGGFIEPDRGGGPGVG